MALLLLFRFVVFHVNHGAADEARGKQHQGSVCIDRKGLRDFLKILALRVFPANAHADLHQHSLTAPLGARVGRHILDLSHAASPKLNYTRLARIVEDIPAVGIQRGNRVS